MQSAYLNINYIRHITAFYALVHEHEYLRSNDISLYMALFQLWNLQRFPVSLEVDKTQAIKLSKIGSKATYVLCLKRLHKFGFLTYQPSAGPFLHSVVKMVSLDEKGLQTRADIDPHTAANKDPQMCTGIDPDISTKIDPDTSTKIDPHIGSVLDHFNNKQINNYINARQTARAHVKSTNEMRAPKAPELEEIRAYFNTMAQPEKEADQFYFHYTAIGWTLGGLPIFEWTAAAEKWINHIPLLKKIPNGDPISRTGEHRSEENKRYDEPF